VDKVASVSFCSATPVSGNDVAGIVTEIGAGGPTKVDSIPSRNKGIFCQESGRDFGLYSGQREDFPWE
jgi:hypothetical protein